MDLQHAYDVWNTGATAVRRDPYEAYRVLRSTGVVHEVPQHERLGRPTWYVLGYAEARQVLSDPRFTRDVTKLPEEDRPVEPLAALGLDRTMLGVDAPDHTRLRSLVSAAFTPRRVEQLRPWITEIADGLLAEMSRHEQVDLVDTYAFPLPVAVIGELLGVPAGDTARFRGWIRDLFAPSGQPAVIMAAAQQLGGYIAELIAAKRAEPDDALISALIAARDHDQALTDAELLSTVTLLLVAGHETTVNLISAGVVALLTHPEQLAALRSDPSLIPGAVEELLRYDGPTEMAVARWALEDVVLGGVKIPAGGAVMAVLGAASHDEALVDDPDELDVRRAPSAHLAFGHGIHYCLGAPLARLEAEVALHALIDAFPGLRLAVPASELAIAPNLALRTLTGVPIALT
jgi:cytochrome P450